MVADTNYTPIQILIDDASDKTDSDVVSSHSVSTAEGEPITVPKTEIKAQSEASTIQEVVEHEPTKEVAPFVAVRKETIDLPPDLKKMGLTQATATSFPSYQSVRLPISDSKVYDGLQLPISSSFRWLAELCLYLLKKAHLTLINIHGKVIRVIKLRS